MSLAADRPHRPAPAGPAARRTVRPLPEAESENWLRAEHLVAFLGTVLIAMRFQLTQQLLTVGDLVAIAMIPIWLPVTRRYLGARKLIFLGLLTVPAGLALSSINAHDHQISRGEFVTATFMMVSVLFGVGFLLWARQILTEGGLTASFGLGLLCSIGLNSDLGLFSTNPWKFGFALPVTIIVLGLIQKTGRREFEFIAVLVLAMISALSDARSAFAILLLTALATGWQLLPRIRTRRGSALRVVLGLGVAAVAVYNLGQALILNGFLGEETQQRTAQQINESGSLILGGRPEITATLNLMRHHPLGFGSATLPNYDDIQVAKSGMAAINYDPNNGYVENWMFGRGFRLHSIFGDLWAHYGVIGLVFAGFVLVTVLRRLGQTLVTKSASAVLLYTSFLTLWNVFFAPFYSSLRMLTLVLALGLLYKLNATSPTPGRPVGRPPAGSSRNVRPSQRPQG